MEEEYTELQRPLLFYSMDLRKQIYNIYMEKDWNGNMELYGEIYTEKYNGSGMETKKEEVTIEDIVRHIVHFFGYQEDIPNDSITYEVEENTNKHGKGKIEMTFYGPFGLLKIDSIQNLTYTRYEDKNEG